MARSGRAAVLALIAALTTGRLLMAMELDMELAPWGAVNDGVMGGLSRSRMVPPENDTAVFEGDVSLENNGGFASVRSRPGPLPTAGTSRLVVRANGAT